MRPVAWPGRRGRNTLRCAALLASLLVLAACTGSAPGPVATSGSPSATASPTTSPTESSSPVTGGGPPVPTSGAYVGAWVQPEKYTQAGFVAAVDVFQTKVGRRLDIVHVYHKWDDDFPTQSDKEYVRDGAYLMLSWAGSDTRSTAAGTYDDVIRARADEIKALNAPVFLEWRWEMDRPNLSTVVHSTADYIAAWRHIRSLFVAEGVTNVSWVWCPTAAGFAAGRAQAYYPGDDQTDWICADAYPGSSSSSLATLMAPVLAFSAAHPARPLMLGEFGVRDKGGDSQAAWLRAAHAWAATVPALKAVVYFDANYRDASGFVSPLSIQGSPSSVSAFKAWLADPAFDPRGLRAGGSG